MQWLDIKIWLESSTGLDRDALHIYGALAIQFSLALFFQRRLASPWPWLIVVAAALANEYFDYQRVGASEAAMALFQKEAYHDIWNTLLVPTALMFVARFWPRWMTGKPIENRTSNTVKVRSEPAV